MNEEKIRKAAYNLNAAILEKMNPFHYCPLCQKPSSTLAEGEKGVTVECVNPHCKMNKYHLNY